MSALYNELEPYPAQWLRNLSDAGHIARGVVDERSIVDLGADDVRPHRQVHLFAGLGGWSHALRLAGWPDDREVWTGSCPCQPYSIAGAGLGDADPRNLWPQMRRLIEVGRPSVVLGEQVASAAGRAWLAAVRVDLEALGYGVGAADLCAAGAGAPHIRQRLYWVAYSNDVAGRQGSALVGGRDSRGAALARPGLGGSGDARGLGHADSERAGRDGGAGAGAEGGARLRSGGVSAGAPGAVGGLGDADDAGPQGRGERGDGADQLSAGPAGLAHWRDVEWLPCRDGKTRPTQPGVRPMADGVPARVGRLRAYGNAICAPLAAQFVRAVMETL